MASTVFNHVKVLNQVENQTIHGDLIQRVPEDSDKADEQCLRDLRLTNPEDDKRRIEQTKDKLLKQSFCLDSR